jgi:hypothetical protein
MSYVLNWFYLTCCMSLHSCRVGMGTFNVLYEMQQPVSTGCFYYTFLVIASVNCFDRTLLHYLFIQAQGSEHCPGYFS